MNKLWTLGLVLALGACAVPIQHQTASGRPEVLIRNTTPDSAKAAIVNGMMSRQYRISRDTPYEIAFDKAVDNVALQLLLATNHSPVITRVSYTLASVGPDVRVVADTVTIQNPGSPVEQRMENLNKEEDSPMAQAFLDSIRSEKEATKPATPPSGKPKK